MYLVAHFVRKRRGTQFGKSIKSIWILCVVPVKLLCVLAIKSPDFELHGVALILEYTQYGPIKNGRIKNQGSDFEKK